MTSGEKVCRMYEIGLMPTSLLNLRPLAEKTSALD